MAYAIGIDLGGTYIKYGLVDQTGAILQKSIKPTYSPGGKTGVFEKIIGIIEELNQYASVKNFRLSGVGIGVPAIIDGGLLTACAANLPDLEGMALGREMEKRLKMTVCVGNDANLMGLAEWKFGAARNATDAIFLTIGTGIGGAMVVNGELYAGHRGRGAELGHLIVALDGLPCGCGGKGCLEAHASVKALIEDYKGCVGVDAEEITGSLIISRYLEKQPAAVISMNHHFDYLAAGVAGLINIFSPEKFIIGGGISEAGDFYIGEIRQRAMSRAMKETSLYTSIETAALGNKAGFLGAAALVFNSSLQRS